MKDSCHKCLKAGHMSKDCKRSKACVHCGEVNTHHRSLCPKKYASNVSTAHLVEETDEKAEIDEFAEKKRHGMFRRNGFNSNSKGGGTKS